MLTMPAVLAFFRQAAPESESRLTIIRTLTPSLIMESQMVPNLAVSPPAFWMSDWIPASVKAFVRLGRSLPSQRGDVVASGRITPTLPDALEPVVPLLPALGLSLLLLLPHAAAPNRSSALAAAIKATRERLVLSICPTSRGVLARDGRHALCCSKQHNRHRGPCTPTSRQVLLSAGMMKGK